MSSKALCLIGHCNILSAFHILIFTTAACIRIKPSRMIYPRTLHTELISFQVIFWRFAIHKAKESGALTLSSTSSKTLPVCLPIPYIYLITTIFCQPFTFPYIQDSNLNQNQTIEYDVFKKKMNTKLICFHGLVWRFAIHKVRESGHRFCVQRWVRWFTELEFWLAPERWTNYYKFELGPPMWINKISE